MGEGGYGKYVGRDEEREEWGRVLEWDKMYYEGGRDCYVEGKGRVRMGLVEWEMGGYGWVDEVLEEVELLVDSVRD